MIVYSASKAEFVEHVKFNQIEKVIEEEVWRKLKRRTPKSEIESWKNSLQYMFNALLDQGIPPSAGVAIEYTIPLTSRRVDFILTGKDSSRNDTAIIVELKQWSEAEVTDKDAIVRTFLNGSIREVNHPSYQAWSYSALIEDYNETVREERISLQPCAYLHNMDSGEAINDARYAEHTERAPVYISSDAKKLSEFLRRNIRYGDSDNILYRIEHGVIKPSKGLADCLASMLRGNREFILLDEQKLVYETALDLAEKGREKPKQTFIVKGGPGTGKSVVAINLIVEATNREMLTQFVSKNAAPREVFKARLTGTMRKTNIDNLFRGSGGYTDTENNYFDMLVVDEAHRLNEKSGLYGNLGENQIKELITSAKTTVFFIDEDQRVTLADIGTVEEIRHFAGQLGAEVTVLELSSQFRCNGSDGYLAWVDHVLRIRETANTSLEGIDYDFRVFDDPNELRSVIERRNRRANKARLVAGYCWDWNSKKDPERFDIELPEHDFRARWNLDKHGSKWLIAEDSISEIGCIHTCQGLELDYVGVIIGEDFVIRDGIAVTNAAARSRSDRSVRGYKKRLKEDRESALADADMIIKNTYRTLMTRGMKGCFIYSADAETREHFRSFAETQLMEQTDSVTTQRLPYEVVDFESAIPYDGFVPVFDLQAAAGEFSGFQSSADEFQWVKLPEHFATRPGQFVAQVVGESMNKRIPNGAWCLFNENPGGTRNGKIVLVQHRAIEDPDNGSCLTVKLYRSEKTMSGDELVNERVILKPVTSAHGYRDIVIEDDDLHDLRVVGEFVAVLA
ncbi:AAA family ATPase [Marinobacter sp. EhC06]|uniref:DNA/RNA helicase domain-containing protein n=1 Tax=Marinobacter TaxID=2742 RepID=UPI0007D8DF19|nr:MULTISPECIES: DNA/RNA helicase domain-containing protein [unclassified Marinobacter]OAN92865.1 AAA family ATPase [Marinobacter sp. EhN04]OAN96391.1 AAA family ATPase [Marinobacter sp. EhC06]